MTKRSMRVKFSDGMEARRIAELVQIAVNFECRVYLEDNSRKVNAKSIMGMMSLELRQNDEIIVIADGPDEEAALEAIGQYLDVN